MEMFDAIAKQNAQLAFEPEIEFADKLGLYEKFVVSGMGGSHLAADILKCWNPLLDIIIHEDYGLPALKPEHVAHRLFIASSYSGNTEEVLDGLDAAITRNMPTCVIAVGGKLIDRAEQEKIPYIKMPDIGIQPRSALGFSMKALLKIMHQESVSAELRALAETLIPSRLEKTGKNLAEDMFGRVPLIYASARNKAIAYNWKIKFNETGKIPAFMNVFPELNHNEMTGFDAIRSSASLSNNFYGIILRDNEDHPRIQKRMEILARLYNARNIPTVTVEIQGSTRFEKIFSCLYAADWAAYYTAQGYGADPNDVPMVEEFKKLIAG
ncbi:MAG: SIS domain-containing protein [bacterium]|nr:SIS domain-containing protein [bacterium]MDZ4285966.1 SIS domain-containing protein [Candidatus Sungbacteria bacterium]